MIWCRPGWQQRLSRLTGTILPSLSLSLSLFLCFQRFWAADIRQSPNTDHVIMGVMGLESRQFMAIKQNITTYKIRYFLIKNIHKKNQFDKLKHKNVSVYRISSWCEIFFLYIKKEQDLISIYNGILGWW